MATNSRIGKRYIKVAANHFNRSAATVDYSSCTPGKLCQPIGYFEMIEKCKICNKIL